MNIDEYMDKIIARALMALRGNVVGPDVSNTSFTSNLSANYGDTVTVPLPHNVGVVDVVPGIARPANTTADPTVESVSVKLDKLKASKAIVLTPQELQRVNTTQDFIPTSIQVAINELVEQANKDIFAELSSTFGYGLRALNTDFASMAEAMKLLNENKVSQTNRNLVVDFIEHAKLVQNSSFADYDKHGEQANELKRSGVFGQPLLGFTPRANSVTSTTNSYTLSAPIRGLAAGTKGDKFVTLGSDSGAQTVPAGTAFYLAASGLPQTVYVVKETTVVPEEPSSIEVPLTAPLLHDVPGSGVVFNVLKDKRLQFAMHPDAIAFVTAELKSLFSEMNITGGPRQYRRSLRDDFTGLTLGMTMFSEYYQEGFQLDMFYGVKSLRPDHAVAITIDPDLAL